MRGRTALAIVLLGSLAAGNSTTAGQERAGGGRDDADPTQAAAIQLIVQFRAGTNPADAALLSGLAAAIGAPVAYLRPLSGGAHLLRVSAPPDALPQIVRQLKSRPEVVDVHPDMPARPQR